MNIGIKPQYEWNTKTLEFYENSYQILRTPDFDDSTRLLKPQNGKQVLGNYGSAKTCRFCGKSEPEVTFKKVAHAFPEAIGNHVLTTLYECDECNSFFGRTIENDYTNFFSLYHSVMQIKGKRGVPRCSFKVPCEKRTDSCAEYCVDIINADDNQFEIRKCQEANGKYVEINNKGFVIRKPVAGCCPIAVYKALVKMALTVMPIEELQLFETARSWILQPEHENIFNKPLLVRYKMIPGFNVTKYPCYYLYKRKGDVWEYPYMLFQLTYACYSLLIELPKDGSNSLIDKLDKIPFPEMPFYANTEGIWDLSNKAVDKGYTNSMEFSYEMMQEL